MKVSASAMRHYCELNRAVGEMTGIFAWLAWLFTNGSQYGNEEQATLERAVAALADAADRAKTAATAMLEVQSDE